MFLSFKSIPEIGCRGITIIECIGFILIIFILIFLVCDGN